METTTVARSKVYKVKDLSGQDIELLSASEQRYYRDAQAKYVSENKFTVSSDLRSVDRLVFFETMTFRWQSWLAAGKDYDGFLITGTEDQLRKNMKETQPLISSLQNELGLTKTQREKEQAESVGAYIMQLQQAARAHGVRREKQLGRAMELMNEILSVAGTFLRSSPHEREKIGFSDPVQIIEWIEEYVRPRYDEVDLHFREHEQRFFIGRL